MQPSPSLATTYHVSEEYDSSDEDDSDEVLVWEEHESSDEDGTDGKVVMCKATNHACTSLALISLYLRVGLGAVVECPGVHILL